jgi:hypothetical protein
MSITGHVAQIFNPQSLERRNSENIPSQPPQNERSPLTLSKSEINLSPKEKRKPPLPSVFLKPKHKHHKENMVVEYNDQKKHDALQKLLKKAMVGNY